MHEYTAIHARSAMTGQAVGLIPCQSHMRVMLMSIATVPPSPSRRGALAALGLCVLLAALGGSVASVALPSLAQAFHQPVAAVQWVVVAYLLTMTALVVGAGRLSDSMGRRRLLLLGLVVFAAASGGCAAASEILGLVIARAFQGGGAAVMMAVSMAMVGDVIPKERTGRAMGLMGTLSAIGTASGPSVGGMLITTFGWPSLFIAVAGLAVLAAGLVAVALRAEPPHQGNVLAFDGVGLVLLAMALGFYAVAMTGATGFGWAERGGFLAGAAGFAGLFVASAKGRKAPLVPFDLLRDRPLRDPLVLSFAVAAVMMATLIVGPFYLSLGVGLKAGQVGVALSVGPVVSALAATPAGQLTDRYGAGRMTRWGLTAMVAGCVVLVAQAGVGGWPGYVAALLILTPGYALFQTANNTGVMRGQAPDRRGVVSGMLNLARNMGLVTGASAMGAVFVWGAGGVVETPGAAAAGLRATFAVAAVVMAAALWMARRGKQP